MIKKRYDKAGPAVAEAMKKRGFDAYYVSTAEEARAKALELIPENSTVSWGGSVTIDEIGLKKAVIDGGYNVINRDEAGTPEERTELMRKALTCDVFLMSANAVSQDGQLVNIDGNGNRIGASLFGPRHVIWVVGRNKIVDGGLSDAIARIRAIACPANARRLGCKTPCSQTGGCSDCHSPDRICSIVTYLERRPRMTPSTVLLVAEDLGY